MQPLKKVAFDITISSDEHKRIAAFTFSAERNIASSFEPIKMLNNCNIMSNILQFGHDIWTLLLFLQNPKWEPKTEFEGTERNEFEGN